MLSVIQTNSILFDSILFYSILSIICFTNELNFILYYLLYKRTEFYSILFYSILSIICCTNELNLILYYLLYKRTEFYSILFYSFLFSSILFYIRYSLFSIVYALGRPLRRRLCRISRQFIRSKQLQTRLPHWSNKCVCNLWWRSVYRLQSIYIYIYISTHTYISCKQTR